MSMMRAGWRQSATCNRCSRMFKWSMPILIKLAVAAVVVGSVIVNAQFIPQDEVETLQTISQKLNISFWKVSRTSCIDNSFSFDDTDNAYILSNVTCDCSFNDKSICHVTNIQLIGLNLTGQFPSEFGNLTYLQEIDLRANYISGSIPTSLTKTPLVMLRAGCNIINGSIPEELGQIPTLKELYFQDNLLGGSLPPSLGNLNRLEELVLGGNNFTGTIPESYGKLKNLTYFSIDGSSLSGNIPDLIGNWTKINILSMLGTGMKGPIPSSISLLRNITELSISDLKGSTMEFPNLIDLNSLTKLTLRNCLITGVIPDYIGDFTHLDTLDLSFNHLTGEIPETLYFAPPHLYLLHNSLSGEVPNWITDSEQAIDVDVSYNNFTGASLASCQQLGNPNLVSSYSSIDNNAEHWCLQKDLPCPEEPKYHSLFLNCGGSKITYDGNDYEDDLSRMGLSNFFAAGTKWGYSSTGYWEGGNGRYVVSKTPELKMTGQELYQTARTAPLSLKYYGLCLRPGSYKVQLHFAEIMYSDDHTYNSVGRRVFDVAIQGSNVLRDFNITKEAGGVGKSLTVTHDDIRVNGSTLEVALYWAGKGDAGPLISAITITPNFKVNTGLSTGSIVGIVLGSIALVALILVFLRLKGCLGGKEDKEFRDLDNYFSLKQIKVATGDFDLRNKIGEGGFGPVYKGVLPDGKVIAVKQLSSKSKQGNREFVNEVGMISAIRHPNLVKLYGWCIEAKELLLIYEYMENNSLSRALFGRHGQRLKLDWSTRMKISLGIARGLAYLHEESRLKIIHRDIKANNVLLDKDLNAKISDFGLAKLDEEENTHMTTRVAGTMGYMAPEYAMRGYLTDKADVYSFGVVILEIISGQGNTTFRPKEEFLCLLDWAYVLHEQGNILELTDPSLGDNYVEEEALRMLNLAVLCTSQSPTLRPRMSSVVGMIEGHAPIHAPIVKNTASSQKGQRFETLSIDSISMHSQFSVSTSSQNDNMQGRPYTF